MTEEELSRAGGDMLITLHRMGGNEDTDLGIGTDIKNISNPNPKCEKILE